MQTIGVWKFGLRLPIMMGVTFTAVTPMNAIGADAQLGLLDIYGATIGSGLISILIALGLFPKLAHVVASVPPFVLGGAGIVMFGMVAATGIRILSTVELTMNRYNPTIIAISIGMGMIPVASDKFFSRLPHALEPLLHSGILLASITAVLLNAHFNGLRSEADASALARQAGKEADATPV